MGVGDSDRKRLVLPLALGVTWDASWSYGTVGQNRINDQSHNAYLDPLLQFVIHLLSAKMRIRSPFGNRAKSNACRLLRGDFDLDSNTIGWDPAAFSTL